MKMLKMLFAAVAAVTMTFAAEAAKTAKAVVEDGGATLRFVYDNLDYGPKGTNWFSVAEAEAIDPISDSVPWEELGDSVTKVVFNSSFANYRPTQCGSWFYGFRLLSQFEGIGNLKTVNATNMAYMFSGCSSLPKLNLTAFKTANVTSMQGMFSNCSSLKLLSLANFDTAKVTDAMWMFSGCTSLTTIQASYSFVTDHMTQSSAMFASCSALKGGAGTAYDSARQDKTYARIDGGAAAPGYFTAVTSFAKVVVENGGTTLRFAYDELGYGEKDVDWYSLADAEAIVDPDSEDVPWAARGGSVTRVVFDESFADYRPSQCSCWFWNFGQLVAVDGIRNLDTSSAKSLAYMFGKCSKLVSLNLSGFDTSKVTNMDGMFRDCTSLTTIYASEKFVTAQVTQSSGVFYQCTSLVGGNGTTFDWDGIAYARIDSPDEPGYFTAVPLIAKVVVEDGGATLRFVYDNLDYGPKGTNWFSVAEAEAKNPSVNPAWHDLAGSVTKVVFDRSFADYRPSHCGCWFSDFENLETIDGLGYLDTSEVTNMYQMFAECSSLVSLNLSGFDTSRVTNMGYMFLNCSSLTTIFASDSFVTTAVSFPVGMFDGCTSILGGMGTTYDDTKFGTAYARIDGGPSAPGYFSQLIAKVVVEDGGTTLRFVYDGQNYGTKGTDWFSVAEAEAIDLNKEAINPYEDSEFVPWHVKRSTVTKVVFDESFAVYRPTQCGKWFFGFKNLAMIENLGNFDTSEATSFAQMFESCSSLTTLDVTGFDTSKVTDMSYMFTGCSSLTSLDLSGFDTANVTKMNVMFFGCSSLTSLDLSSFDTSKVADMYYMFASCSSLTTLDVTGFDTSKVTSMNSMFYRCSLLTTLDVTGFDTSKVTDMSYMFSRCSSLTTLDVTGFDTSKVTDMECMFSGCSLLTTLDVTGFDTANVTDMCGMFEECSLLTTLDVTGFDTSKVTDMSYMFSRCSLLTTLDVTGFDTSKVTDMACMFTSCSSLASLDLSGFDTANVEDMYAMFYCCSSLESLDVTGFDTANVTEMEEMFFGCSVLGTIVVSDKFVTTAVLYSWNMFDGCSALVGGKGTAYDAANPTDATYARIDGGASAPGYFTPPPPVAKAVVLDDATLKFVYDNFDYGEKNEDWFSVAEAEAIDPCLEHVPWYGKHSDVTKVVFDESFAAYQPTQCGSWFYNFDQLDTIENLGNLDTSETTSFAYMFSGCSSIESLDVSCFDTAKVTDMSSMFDGCFSLESLNVSCFDTAKVTDISAMFCDCWVLESLDVSCFDTSEVTCMYCMFHNCSSLSTIFVSDAFVTTAVTDLEDDMFGYCAVLRGGAGTTYDSANIDVTYARIDGGPSAPGYFTLKTPVGGFAAWAAAKGLAGADAAWDAKPALWGGKWENGFIYTFGEGLADGTLAIMDISFDLSGKPVITTTPVVEGHDDFTPAVIGTPNLQNWTSPVMLENKSGNDWTLPVGAAANFFRVRLSE